jgi:hypothetical protein
MLNPNRDLNYAKIVRSRDRGKMYKYKLIRSIVRDLDEYLKENNITIIDNESTLLSIINLSYRKHSLNLTRYFKVIGYNANVTIDTSDIEDWTFKYKWHHKLYLDDKDKLTYG